MRMKLKWLFMPILLVISFDALAMRLTLSATDVNDVLAGNFPIVRNVEGMQIVYDNPEIVLDVLESEIELTIIITVQKAGMTFTSKGLLKGRVERDVIDNTLELVKPWLDELKVVSSEFSDNKPFIRVIRQSASSNLPDLTFVDFSDLKIEYQGRVFEQYVVVKKGLELRFQ